MDGEWRGPDKEAVNMALKVRKEAKDDVGEPKWSHRDSEWSDWILNEHAKRFPHNKPGQSRLF